MNKMKRISLRLLRNIYAQAILVGLLVVLPFATYISLTHSIIAPLNIMGGWDVSSAHDSVVAQTPSDVNQQMLPFREYIKESLVQHHEIPLWNTKSFAGDTFIANPINTALSPFNVLLFFLDIYMFQNIIVLFGLFLMSAFMYLLLRQKKLSVGASMLGAVAYTLAPFSIFWSIYGIVSIPMAFIPLILYLYNEWKLQNKSINLFLLLIILSLGSVVYLGHIQIALLVYVVLFLAVFYDLLFSKMTIKRISYLVAGTVVALLIGAAQIIPMVSQTPLSHRASEIAAEPIRPWGERLIELSQIPTAYNLASGPVDLGLIDRRVLSVGQIPGLLMIIAVGMLITKLVRRQSGYKNPIFYALLFILGAFWQWNDFPQTILNIVSPTLRSLATDYFLPIALVGMSVLAAYGLDWILKSLFDKTKKGRTKLTDIFFGLPMIGVIAVSTPQLMLSRVTTLDSTYYTLYYVTFVFALLFYILHKNRRLSAIYFSSTIVIIALMQGWAIYRVSQPIVPYEITQTKNQLLNYITSNETNTQTIVDYASPQESALYNISLVNGYDSLYSSSILKRIQAINYPNATPISYRNNAPIINSINKPTLFKNLGVSYTINKKPASGYVEQVKGVYKADQPTPGVYFAEKIRSQKQEAQLHTIQTGDVQYHEVLVDGAYQVADPSSTIQFNRTPNTLTLTTNSPDGGLVFIAQTYNKDWKAILDKNTPIDILPAYYDFSAINVPQGEHTVTLEYIPLSSRVGFGVSVTILLFVIIIVIYMIWKRYSPRKADNP